MICNSVISFILRTAVKLGKCRNASGYSGGKKKEIYLR